MGCGGTETPNDQNPPPGIPTQDTLKEPAAKREPDNTTWFSTEKTAKLEGKLGLTSITDRAKAIEAKVPEMEVENQSCKLWYGPGNYTIYRLGGKVAKLRVDWAVETAHSHIEYYFEDDKMFLMDFYSRDYGNKPEAEESYNYGKPNVVKNVAGRYYLENEKVKNGIMSEWLAGEEEKPYTEAPLPEESKNMLNQTFENDMNNWRLIFEGKMKCADLADAGYFP